MNIKEIQITQRSLKRASQIPGMLQAIEDKAILPPIMLCEYDDGTIQVDNGHHRLTAYWMSSRIKLEPWEYTLVYKEGTPKASFGNIEWLAEEHYEKFLVRER